MLENWKNALAKGDSVCVVFMDISKAFDTINYILLLVKPKVHGFSKDALSLMCSYLKNREQRAVINNSASTTNTVFAEVLQGSIGSIIYYYVSSRICYILLYILYRRVARNL